MTLYNGIPGHCKSGVCVTVTVRSDVLLLPEGLVNCLNVRGERERCLHKYHHTALTTGSLLARLAPALIFYLITLSLSLVSSS